MTLQSALRDGVVSADDVAASLDAARVLAQPTSHEELLAAASQLARQLTGADGATVVLRELDHVHYVEEAAIAPLWKGRRFPIESCLSGWAITHAQSVVIEDVFADPRIPHDVYEPTFVKSMLMVPVSSGRPIAAIGAYWATAHRATPREQLLLEMLAQTLALALSKQAAEADIARAASLGEIQFRALFDSMPQLGWTARPDGNVDFYNRGWYEYTGTTFEDVSGWGWQSVHDPALLPQILEGWRRSIATETPFEMEFPLRRADGQFRWFLTRVNPIRDARGTLVRWVGINTDIHARRVAGEASDERMRLLIESIRDYALFMLDPSGHIVSWNAGAERINQYRAEEIIGRHFSTFYTPEDLTWDKCAWALGVAASEGRFEEEGWRVRKDGSRFWADVIINAVRDPEGKLVGFAKVTRDLTERKRVEAERAGRIAAERANRAKDEFLAMLGHELRNPLSPIVTALQLMRLRGDTTSQKEQEVIERQVRHLTRLVDDLLDVSRVAGGKIELTRKNLELANVIVRAVEMASPLFEAKQQELVVEVATRGLSVNGDETRLAQIFANLLTNAAKYTDARGRVAVVAVREGDDVVVRVRDNGIGIAPDLLPRVFDLFTQGAQGAERSRGGLGLGLTLVRSLVELHGGSVSAHSDGEGRGSELVVRLPLVPVARTDHATDGTARVRIGLPAPSERRVLIVDDNVDAAELLGELLRGLGHTTALAHDGVQALELAERFQPEIAILDIGLPVMDGYELAARLRATPGETRPFLIALTGYGQPHDKLRAIAAGFDRHLVKPVQSDALLQSLRAAAPATAG